jgi:hypothetical protein
MSRANKKQLEERRRAIEACTDKHGRILPRLVVDAARSPRSPLHKEFEWDDRKAALVQRLDRAQELIREVKLMVIHDTIKISAPFFVSDPTSRESAYVATTTAAKDEELSEAILMDELRRIESAIVRARSLAAAFDLIGHFDRMLSDVVEVRGRLARRGKGSGKGDGDGPRPTA